MKLKLISFAAFLFLFLTADPEARCQWVQTPGDFSVNVFAFATSGTTVIAGTGGNGMYRLTDTATAWEPLEGLADANVFALVANSTSIFAAISGSSLVGARINRSFDNGTTWTAANAGIEDIQVNALALIGTTLFAGTNRNGFFRSTDNGTSWTNISMDLSSEFVYNGALVVSGSNLFAGTYGGVFLSTDSGVSWTAVNNGLISMKINALAVSGTDLFAGTNDAGVFFSSDNGANWTQVNNGITNLKVNALLSSGANIFAGTMGGGLLLTKDKGTTWTDASNGMSTSFVLALGISGQNVFSSGGFFTVWRRPLSEFGSSSVAERESAKTIELSPNPTPGIVKVRAYAWGMKHVTIMNTLGEDIMQIAEPASTDFTLDLSNLPAGAYFIRLSGAESTTTRMIVRE